MATAVTEYDTIAAISTPIGEGAISIVRLSGEDAVEQVNRLFKGKDLTDVDSHTIHYGHILDATTQKPIDEVMVSVMRAPKTFTREDIVEINCHGGVVATNRILQNFLGEEVRLAEPGEFTKRAFLNGRIDLTQAESVMDLIRAKTDKAMQVAVNQLDGQLNNLIHNLREEILQVLAQVEVNIDYPEYDMDDMTTQLLLEKAQHIQTQIDGLLQTAKQGKILRHGLATALVGRPNVGKSSLLNYLIKEDKAIVTDIEGTTRDVLEEYVNVRDVPLKLVDTAGIRQTKDVVEKIGVERSKKAINESDLVLLVINAAEELTGEDQTLLELTRDKNRIILLNKIDLGAKISRDDLINQAPDTPIIEISVQNTQGLDQLEEQIATMFFGGIETNQTDVMVTNARQIGLLTQAQHSLDEVIAGIANGMPIDLVQIDMTACWDKLGEITGESAPDELITQLFSQFCLGK
ncbi:tRNA uridine-5-carboxymethylaminomethyl(34) synthesis GTPase MnmE [Holzapfeliella floricola]|uniref:tRNA modification GTPase MnmE n=1 Tax=Holzapfeliella floricola DSM 23037 = JCM 16512 TaxID=1423744 RepID=A0A0R2DL58_9LACO|nr:tRNA uridine-5-carboxymethylaminomethyl(34) synthesis GTPase MnmE [Holzapfeliella floricola]KRN04879.1 tRNA modification GTPase TrmE [Holzapfeliella floricola DSM 23037 = JCM 16512]